jgi:hypothetical protein
MMRLSPVFFGVALLAHASDQGLPPRPGPTDYPARTATDFAAFAAEVMPARLIERTFTSDIAKNYIVVEVAIYPQNGKTFEVDWLNFGLKAGGTVVRPEKPRDVAEPWQGNTRVPDKPVTVITDTGVTIAHTSDPVYGKRTSVGTYESVGVTNDPRAASSPTPRDPGPDPQIVEKRIAESMLPKGPSDVPIAGYLFFPKSNSKRKKSAAMELHWSRPGVDPVVRLEIK